MITNTDFRPQPSANRTLDKSRQTRLANPLARLRTALMALPIMVWSLVTFVALPTLFSAGYWGLLASNIYVSEARFAIRAAGGEAATGLLDQFSIRSSPGSTAEDAEIVRDYIHSRDLLEVLDMRLELRAHFESDRRDFLSRLDSSDSEEDYLDYYRDKITITIDESSHITTLQARAFSQAMAKRLAAEILARSETLVNEMSATIAEDTLTFARDELEEAEEKVRTTTLALTAFRTQNRSINPGEETSAVLGIVTQLEGKLAQARANFTEARSFMRGNSARVRNLRARVTALEVQVERERSRFAGETSGDLTNMISGYEPLALEQNLAREQYSSALASLEAARAEAQRKQRYLIAFVQPTRPDEAVEPERLWNAVLTFLLSLVTFGIAALVWSAVKEHARL